MRAGTYEEIMAQITASKRAELLRAAKLPFKEKLTAVTRLIGHVLLSESLAHPVLEVIRSFNAGVERGLFNRFALAGGLAVEYYGAPINTLDAGFLVVFPETSSGLLDPSGLYEFFKAQGATTQGEHLVLKGLRFQMIPAQSGLGLEALQAAVPACEENTPFFVVSLEHLVAMKLGAWRFKDRLHINHLLDSGASVDQTKLAPILQRYSLEPRWRQLLLERGEGGTQK